MRDAAKLYIRLKETLERLSGQKKRDPLKIIREWELLAKNVLGMIRNENTTVYLVTIPEGLGVTQTERIWEDFKKFGVNIGGLIINTVITDSSGVDTKLLDKRRKIQTSYIDLINKKYSNTARVRLFLQEYEVKGISALKEIEKQLYN
jgi:anion-transporting  ArsA/GET3 family ATPase